MENRTDKRATKRAPKRKLGQRATKVSHLCGVNNLNAEHKAWIAAATANDGTYISTSFVKRTTVVITLNEVIQSKNVGGIMGKRVKASKPEITVVADSQENAMHVLKSLGAASSRSAEHANHEAFELTQLFRPDDESKSLQDVVLTHIANIKESRSNGKRDKADQDGILEEEILRDALSTLL